MPTDISTREEAGALATIDYEKSAGHGMEHADAKSYSTPFIIQLQANSPQIETMDGVKPGLFLNTATNEVYQKLRVIPCHFQRRHLRWAPRSQGGGFRGEYDSKLVDSGRLPGVTEYEGTKFMDVPEGTKPVDKDGKGIFDSLSDTRTHYVLVESAEGAWQPAIISFKSTQVKKSKRWMTRMGSILFKKKDGSGTYNPAMYSHIYEITAVKEENAEGSWWGMEVNLVKKTEDEDPTLFQLAENFYTQIQQGTVEVATPGPDIQ